MIWRWFGRVGGPVWIGLAAVLAGCGGESKPGGVTAGGSGVEEADRAAELADIQLGREWVTAMLDETEVEMAAMRERIEGARRELKRLEEESDAGAEEAARVRLGELYDREAGMLRRIAEQGEEMRKVLDGGKAPAGAEASLAPVGGESTEEGDAEGR